MTHDRTLRAAALRWITSAALLALVPVESALAKDIVFGSFMANPKHDAGSWEVLQMTSACAPTETTAAFSFTVPPDITYALTRIETVMSTSGFNFFPGAYVLEVFDGPNPPDPSGFPPPLATSSPHEADLSGNPDHVLAVFPTNAVKLLPGNTYWVRASFRASFPGFDGCEQARWHLNYAGVDGPVATGSFSPSFPGAGAWTQSNQAIPAVKIYGDPCPAIDQIKAAYNSYATIGGPNPLPVEMSIYPEVFCPPGPISQYYLKVTVTAPANSSSADVCALLAAAINDPAAPCFPGAVDPCPTPHGFKADCSGNILRVRNCNPAPCPDAFVCADRGSNVDIFRLFMASEVDGVEGLLKMRLYGQATGLQEDPSAPNGLRVIHTRRCAGGQFEQVYDVDVPFTPGMTPADIVIAATNALSALGDPDVVASGDLLEISPPSNCPPSTPMATSLSSATTGTMSPGTGGGNFLIDPVTNSLFGNVTFSGLLGASTGALVLVNPAAPHVVLDLGANGGLGMPDGSVFGSVVYPEMLEALLLNGEAWVAIQTTAFPLVEIAGSLHLSQGPPAQGPANYDIAVKLNDTGLGFAVSPVDDLLALVDGEVIGTRYCNPAVPNSTGEPGILSVTGSTQVFDNTVLLTAARLPGNQFGYFINADSQGLIPNPGGSQGNLCVVGSVGRYDDDVFNTGTAGSASLPLDLNATPTPAGFVAVMAGDTWNFQFWHRDLNPGVTSNFTDAVSVTFN